MDFLEVGDLSEHRGDGLTKLPKCHCITVLFACLGHGNERITFRKKSISVMARGVSACTHLLGDSTCELDFWFKSPVPFIWFQGFVIIEFPIHQVSGHLLEKNVRRLMRVHITHPELNLHMWW